MMKTQLRCALAALILFAARAMPGQAASAAAPINPGEIWRDDRGEHINAHGGGILKAVDTWYWFGEYRPKDAVKGRRWFPAIRPRTW
jgi:hypothetical protein